MTPFTADFISLHFFVEIGAGSVDGPCGGSNVPVMTFQVMQSEAVTGTGISNSSLSRWQADLTLYWTMDATNEDSGSKIAILDCMYAR